MQNKKIERGKKCFEIAEKEMKKESPDVIKVVRFLKKSLELDPQPNTKTLLEKYGKIFTKQSKEEEKNEKKIKINTWTVQPKDERNLDVDSPYRKFKSLKDFGYEFNEEKKLVQIKENSEGFSFISQSHYDWVGVHVVRHVQSVYTKSKEEGGFGLVEKWIPEKMDDGKYGSNMTTEEFLERPQVNIFHTPNAFESEGTLLIIVNGMGVVRSGIWAMSLCINQNLTCGTPFPYLEEANKRGWEVLILNPNRIKTRISGKPIEKNESQFEHLLFVYDEYIKKAKAKNVVVVGHSFAGCAILEAWMYKRPNFCESGRLKSIAFTDSVHLKNEVLLCQVKVQKFLEYQCRNWIADKEKRPRDSLVGVLNGVYAVSSGTDDHIWTSHYAKDSVFEFFDFMLLDDSKKMEMIENKKKEGNVFLVKEKQFSKALLTYSKCVSLLDTVIAKSDNLENKMSEAKTKIQANIALAYMKQGNYKQCVNYSSLVIGIEPNNVKCLKRRCYSLIKLRKFAQAESDVERILKIMPEDKESLRHREIIKRYLKK